MSGSEKLRMYAERLTEEQATVAVKTIEGCLHSLEEAVDDAYCMKLLEETRRDPRDD